jgi:hypothetical protein
MQAYMRIQMGEMQRTKQQRQAYRRTGGSMGGSRCCGSVHGQHDDSYLVATLTISKTPSLTPPGFHLRSCLWCWRCRTFDRAQLLSSRRNKRGGSGARRGGCGLVFFVLNCRSARGCFIFTRIAKRIIGNKLLFAVGRRRRRNQSIYPELFISLPPPYHKWHGTPRYAQRLDRPVWFIWLGSYFSRRRAGPFRSTGRGSRRTCTGCSSRRSSSGVW